jgi:rubrerythrin
MNVLDFALKMELDGEQYYRKQAEKVKYEDLKVVLEALADDEHRHYEIVQALQHPVNNHNAVDSSVSKVKNVFELSKNKEFIPKDKESIAKFKDEQLDVYLAALLKEEESVKLYKKMLETAEGQYNKGIIEKLVHEEELHAQVLGNIIEMFNRTNEWVESPEFNHQKPY